MVEIGEPEFTGAVRIKLAPYALNLAPYAVAPERVLEFARPRRE